MCTLIGWEKRVIVEWRNKRQAFPLTCQDKSGNPIRFQIPIHEMCPRRPLALPTLFDPSPMHSFLQPMMMGCGLRGSEPEFLHRVDYNRRPRRECVRLQPAAGDSVLYGKREVGYDGFEMCPAPHVGSHDFSAAHGSLLFSCRDPVKHIFPTGGHGETGETDKESKA